MDVVTVGEAMVLFTPDESNSLERAMTFTKHLASAESNVAIALARLGHDSAWMGKVGNDGFGRYVLKTLRGEGVNVSGVKVDAARQTGVFFKEQFPFLGTSVQYYRKNAAGSHICYEDLNVSLIHSARIFHITGITPALSGTNQETLLRLLKEARANGVMISFDPNIRYKLWSADKAVPILCEIANYADIVLPGLNEGRVLSEQTTPEGIADFFLSKGSKLVVIKLGPDGAYYQTQDDGGIVEGFKVTLVDEVGAGDAFAAGLLSGLLDGVLITDAVRRACALGAMAVCGKGDYETLPTRDEMRMFLMGDSSETKR